MSTALKHPEVIADKVSRGILRENSVLPASNMANAPFPSVATSSKGLLQEESHLLMVYTSDWFDPDAYTLMEELGYDFNKSPSPRHVINAKLMGPIMHKKWYKNKVTEL